MTASPTHEWQIQAQELLETLSWSFSEQMGQILTLTEQKSEWRGLAENFVKSLKKPSHVKSSGNLYLLNKETLQKLIGILQVTAKDMGHTSSPTSSPLKPHNTGNNNTRTGNGTEPDLIHFLEPSLGQSENSTASLSPPTSTIDETQSSFSSQQFENTNLYTAKPTLGNIHSREEEELIAAIQKTRYESAMKEHLFETQKSWIILKEKLSLLRIQRRRHTFEMETTENYSNNDPFLLHSLKKTNKNWLMDTMTIEEVFVAEAPRHAFATRPVWQHVLDDCSSLIEVPVFDRYVYFPKNHCRCCATPFESSLGVPRLLCPDHEERLASFLLVFKEQIPFGDEDSLEFDDIFDFQNFLYGRYLHGLNSLLSELKELKDHLNFAYKDVVADLKDTVEAMKLAILVFWEHLRSIHWKDIWNVGLLFFNWLTKFVQDFIQALRLFDKTGLNNVKYMFPLLRHAIESMTSITKTFVGDLFRQFDIIVDWITPDDKDITVFPMHAMGLVYTKSNSFTAMVMAAFFTASVNMYRIWYGVQPIHIIVFDGVAMEEILGK